MYATIPYIQQKFEEFNRQLFAGQLPMPRICLSDAKSFLGMCRFKRHRRADGTVENFDFSLRINRRIEMTEEVLEDTIIHEMIHYYIAYNQLKDTSSHGPLFRGLMEGVNERFGRHLSISHHPTEEQRKQAVDTRKRWHVVAIVAFADGQRGVKVLPRLVQRILNYYNCVLSLPEVESIRLYRSSDSFFNRFPTSSALNVFFTDATEVAAHLKDAEPLACDGKQVKKMDQV